MLPGNCQQKTYINVFCHLCGTATVSHHWLMFAAGSQ